MKKVNTALNAHIEVICGSSGSGKSSYVKKGLKGKRIMVWDIDDEYSQFAGFQRVTTKKGLIDAIKNKSGRIAFVSHVGNFNYWCRVVFAWRNCTAIAEELADVTTPAKAPAGWGALVRRGRKRGIKIYGITQRPAESDKTIFGNASVIHCMRLTRAGDRSYMSKEMDIPINELSALQNLQYIQKHTATGAVKKGRISYK